MLVVKHSQVGEEINMERNVTVDEEIIWETDKVFVGDICYALDNKLYRDVWGDKLHYADGKIEEFAVVASAAYGDGLYKGTDGTKYCVDAGVIGVTNGKYFNADTEDADLEDLGKLVHIPSGSARITFWAEDGVFEVSVIDAKSGEDLLMTRIDTGEDANVEYCCDCGMELSDYEVNRFGGQCEDCYEAANSYDDEDDDEDDF